MTINQYIEIVEQRFKSGISREHSYRADLEQLLRSLVPDVNVTNEPANVTDCGNPDYVITKGRIPVGYIEAKDIGKDLNSKSYKEQFTRYKNALDNLIITDYLWFQFFQNGELVFETRLAEVEGNSIICKEGNFKRFEDQIKDFCTYIGQTIKSSSKLAKMMASKARLFQNILEKATTSDEETDSNSSLQEQYKAFKQILIHDITPKAFADIYAQTLTYGMFAARLHDTTLDDFSRQEAAELIPKSNPFLRKLFQYIAGYDIDERIVTTVENLAEVFRATNLRDLLADFGKATQQSDPIIHFYETFLAEYDPKLRKARGVWYTPEPVVKFIVRAVDDILKDEFGLKDGLADTSKTKIKVNTQTPNRGSKSGFKQVEQEVHRVQILDPATGTGTFLAEVIKYIYNGKFKAMQGVWSSYVENDLIPRLNGFELLMASYAMAHLKLDLLLEETGFKAKKDQRFRVYLTNSLEEHHPDTGTLFANWLSTEANEANHIKRDSPVMCVIGNPPYAVSSTNKNPWIENLIDDYKKDLKEKSYNSLSDDYVKFMRYGQHFIHKNGSGILAYISNNSFIDGLVFRQMRKNLLETFDKTYILDLHGNAKKKEICPDGSADQNVFDIMQGVSINIFIKNENLPKGKLGEVFHYDLFGKREIKYEFLGRKSLNEINWEPLKYIQPNYYFVRRDYEALKSYNNGFCVESLFNIHATGIKTERDVFTIKLKENELNEVLFDLKNSEVETIRVKHNLKPDGRDWTLQRAKEDVLNNSSGIRTVVQYRPFDNRHTYYTNKSKGFLAYPRNKIMDNLIKENICFVTTRLNRGLSSGYNFVSKNILDSHLLDSAADSLQAFPLFIYPNLNNQKSIVKVLDRIPNFKTEIIQKLEVILTLTFKDESELSSSTNKSKTFAPLDILDYIYCIVYSPKYRNSYSDFLKKDYPKIPYPKDPETFWALVKLGGEIRQIHLLESPKVEDYITSYPKDGNNEVTTKIGKKDWELHDEANGVGRIWINDEQYFDKVPLTAWEFYIGGYQPAQKWLKDRRGRELSFDDILHYQKIIVALTETDRLMKEIGKIEII